MPRLRCVSIVSRSPEVLVPFYETVFDTPANQLAPGRWELPVEEVTLVFTHTDEPVQAPKDSCGLEFETGDVDALYTRLAGLGIALDPPVTYPWGWRAIGFRDPDGNHMDFAWAGQSRHKLLPQL